MVHSMTAFARVEQAGTHGTLSWELRSVNHRYLEPHLRLPDAFRDLEGAVREALRQGLSRGKVECTLRELVPTMLANQRQKILDRFAELKAELDPQRLEQELVLLAQKSDVAEELDRLATHVGEVRRVLKAGGAAGRRLDFLMQELNREANTLGSKAFDPRSTQAAVNLKVLIEQMREQVQNIE